MPKLPDGPPSLKVPQVRVLAALAFRPLNRARLSAALGLSPVSGTITRAMHGLREGSSSGPAHAGLLELGFVEEFERDVDGLAEAAWRITDAGRAFLESWLKSHELPERLRDAKSSVNKRYLIDSD